MKYEAVKDKVFVKVPVFNPTRTTANLTSVDAMVFGYLLFLARKQGKASQTSICSSLHLDRQSGKRSLDRLRSHQLADAENGKWFALEAGSGAVFQQISNAQGEWWDRFIYDRVHIPKSAEALPLRANLLFWHLVRMADEVRGMPGCMRVGGHSNRYYTHTYWATALGCDRKTAGASIARLVNLKLINIYPYYLGYAVGIFPLKTNRGLWRDDWQDKPRVAKALTAKELFSVPSSVAVQEEPLLFKAICKRLRRYKIAGDLGMEIAALIINNNICPTVWEPMLLKAKADNYANWECGKTRNQHCGYLFRHVLHEWVDAKESSPGVVISTSADIRLENELAALGLGQKERQLLDDAIYANHLMVDGSLTIPCELDAEKVAEIANAAKGDKQLFKKLVVAFLCGAEQHAAEAVPWVRRWLVDGSDPEEDNTALEMAGIPEFDHADIRKWAYRCLTGDDGLGKGEIVGQINMVLMIACWQTRATQGWKSREEVRTRIEELAELFTSPSTDAEETNLADEDRVGLW